MKQRLGFLCVLKTLFTDDGLEFLNGFVCASGVEITFGQCQTCRSGKTAVREFLQQPSINGVGFVLSFRLQIVPGPFVQQRVEIFEVWKAVHEGRVLLIRLVNASLRVQRPGGDTSCFHRIFPEPLLQRR